MAYKLLSQSEKLNRRGILIRTGLFENLLKKISGGTLIKDPRVYTCSLFSNVLKGKIGLRFIRQWNY